MARCTDLAEYFVPLVIQFLLRHGEGSQWRGGIAWFARPTHYRHDALGRIVNFLVSAGNQSRQSLRLMRHANSPCHDPALCDCAMASAIPASSASLAASLPAGCEAISEINRSVCSTLRSRMTQSESS